LISRSVRWQNMAWSKGVMRLMATFVELAMWTAELDVSFGVQACCCGISPSEQRSREQ